jgi:hypothetical protein
MMIRRQRHAGSGKAFKICPGESMAPWTFSIKFPYDAQFIFGSLLFATGEDGNLELLTRGPTPRHHVPVYGTAPYHPADPSTSVGACSGLNPHAGQYYLSVMTSQGHQIGKTIFQTSTGTSSSSSSGATPDWHSIEDYPEIRDSAYWNPAIEARRISMAGLARGNSQNNSSRYISEESDARTPSNKLVQNLNLYLKVP